MGSTLFVIWKKNKKLIIPLLLFAAVSGVMMPLIVKCEEQVVDVILVFLEGAPVSWEIISPLLYLAGGYACTYLMPVLAELLYERLWMRLDTYFGRQRIGKMQRIQYQCTEEKEVLDLYARIEKNMDQKLGDLVRNFCDLLSAMIGVVGFFTIICSVSAVSAVIFALLFIVLLFFADRSAKNFFSLNRQFAETERRVVYLDSVENTKQYAHEKKLFGFTDYINQKRSSFLLGQRKEMRKYDYKYGLTFSMIDTAGYVCTVLLMIAMLPGVLQGRISIGLFIAASHAAANLNLSTQNKIRTVFNGLMEQRRFWKEYNGFMALPDQGGMAAEGEESGAAAAFESLEFKDVTFCYPNGTKVLEHMSFCMEKGKQYALVGENGAGKSTIVKLMLRLYEVEEGEILLNGRNIREYGQQELYRCFAAVFQDFSRYYVSVLDNIVFGKTQEPDRAQRALEEMELQERISRLPDGVNTHLGEIYEDGVNLSGGEWQRLAFARALYRDAPVILLDEPTSALDPIAENEIYNHFGRIARNKTTLFITHRLASARMADEILVLGGGRVVEKGSHDTLYGQNGLYRRMYDSQKKWYTGEGKEA